MQNKPTTPATMPEDKKKSRSTGDKVEKAHKKDKKEKKAKESKKADKKVRTAEAAFSLLADEKAANPALAALFAAQVCAIGMLHNRLKIDNVIATSFQTCPSTNSGASKSGSSE